MKFSGQKFFIFLGFFLVPILFVGALLREPIVNRGLLRITMSILKQRLGASIKARTWKVDLSKFAVAIEGIEFDHDKLHVSVDELRAEFSPLFLIIGRIDLSRVWINQVKVEGIVPPLKKKLTEEKEKSFSIENELNKLGDLLIDAQNALDEQKVGFESLELSSLQVNTDRVKLREADLKIEDYGIGHLKTEIVAEDLSGEPELPKISRVLASVVLYSDGNNAYLSVRRLNFELANDEKLHTTIEMKGRIPGDVTVELISDLAQLNKWMLHQKNPDLLNWAKENKISGYVELTGSGESGGNAFKKADFNLRMKNILLNELSLAEASAEFQFEGKNWMLAHTKGRFNATPFDKQARNQFSAENIRVEDNKLLGGVQLERMGLCALLRGVGVPECYLDLVVSGNIALEGALDPLKLTPKLDLTVEPFTVYTDPATPKAEAEGRLLKSKAGKVVGTVEVRDKDFDFTDVKARFGKDSELGVQGNLKYHPTRLFLKVADEKAHFEDILEDFLDQPVAGALKAQATIDYDYQRSKELGKTDIFADALLRDLNIAGLPLGDATSKVQYTKNILEFQPIVRMGPGTLQLKGRVGRLDPSLHEGQMSIDAHASDYEILVPRKEKSAIFDAVLNFDTHLAGSLKKGSSRPFGGQLNAELHSLSSFGIPFERGNMKSYVDLTGIKILELDAYKGNSKTMLKGFLGGKPSHVEFSTEPLPLRQLGFNSDIEHLAQSGDLDGSGWWSMEKGWAIDAECRDLKIGGAAFSQLEVHFASSRTVSVAGGPGPKSGAEKKEDGFFISAKGDESLELEYDDENQNLRAKLKDAGILLALAVINKWENPPEFLKINGDVDVNWAPSGGKIALNALDFQVTDRWNREDRHLFALAKPADILYKNSIFQGNASFISGSGHFDVKSDGGDLTGTGNLSARFFDFFIPSIIRFVDGNVALQARWKPQSSDALQANAKLQNVSAYLPFLGTELRAINGTLSEEKSRLHFAKIAGTSADGSFELNGTMALGDGPIHLQAKAASLPMRVGRDLDMVTSGNFSIDGEAQPYVLSGKAKIERGLLRKEFSEAGIKTAVLEKPWVNFNVPFDVLPNFQIKNTLTDSFISGQGLLSGNDLVPNISGRFVVVKGILYAKDNEFQLSSARVEIPQNTKIDPVKVSVQASTVKANQGINYRIFLAAEGDPNNLRLSFRSEPTLSEKETISLLTLGYIPQQDQTTLTPSVPTTSAPNASTNPSNAQSSVAQGASAEAFQMLFGQALGKGIQKQTGFDVRVGTSADLKQEDTIPKVTVYRKLNDRMSVTFGKSLDVSQPENNFKIDYRLLKNLNLTGVWENPDEDRNSLGFDLRLEFDIK